MPVEIDRDNDSMRARRSLRRSGNSVVLSFPPALLDEAGLELGDEVEIIAPFDTEEITIRKSVPSAVRTLNTAQDG